MLEDNIGGLDVGFYGTKLTTSEGDVMFRSACKLEQVKGFGDSKNYIHIEGSRYLVGQGVGLVSDDKSTDLTFKVCMLKALSRTNLDSVRVVTGLPVSKYALYKKKMEHYFTGNVFEIGFDNEDGSIDKRIIEIKEFIVMPEGLMCLSDTENDNLVIDIGGHSVDVYEFSEGAFIKTVGYSIGQKELYSDIAQELKRLGSDVEENKIPDYIRRGTYLLNGVVTELNHKPYREQHFDKILGMIRNDFKYSSCTHTFVGGGAIDLADIILEREGIVVQDNSIFKNSTAFRQCGLETWK